MTVCLKSSSLRWGRKQSIRSQVISQRAEGLPPRVSALWKISAVSITRSMFFRDSGMASDCRWQWVHENRKEGMGEDGKKDVTNKGETVSLSSRWERKQAAEVKMR